MRVNTLLAGAGIALVTGLAGAALAQDAPAGAPPTPETCVPEYFTAKYSGLEMPIAAGTEGEACITPDPANPLFKRIMCFVGQINETEHPEVPAPHQCEGVGPDGTDQCESVKNFSTVSAGWRKNDEGAWTYCVKVSNRHDFDYRFFTLFAE